MYTLLVTGDVPGAATYFNPLLKQTIVPCTSGTRPSSPVEGQTIYETDTDLYQMYDGSAWRPVLHTFANSYTPSWQAVTTNPTLGNGTITGTWSRIGTWVAVRIALNPGSTTNFGSGKWTFSLPTTPTGNASMAALLDDTSATTRYGCSVWVSTGTGVFGVYPGTGTAGVGGSTPFTWAAGDNLLITGVYESSN